jgi:hypothetical protein
MMYDAEPTLSQHAWDIVSSNALSITQSDIRTHKNVQPAISDIPAEAFVIVLWG